MFTGVTTIKLLPTGGMEVTNAAATAGGQVLRAAHERGGLRRQGDLRHQDSKPIQVDYSGETGCAKLYVSGTYTKDLTLASADDIIVKSPDGVADPMLTRKSDDVLGLIADNYVRVYHKVKTVPTVRTRALR